MGVQTILPTTTITTAVSGATPGPVIDVTEHREAIFTAVFDYGSGGTTVKVWIQTNLGGNGWIDVANFAFTTADATRIQEVNADVAAAANITPTDGTLADNTRVDGILGSRYRVKLNTTGTYAGSTTLTIYMHTR